MKRKTKTIRNMGGGGGGGGGGEAEKTNMINNQTTRATAR